jgi:purine-binding chemotaxis protein CheW
MDRKFVTFRLGEEHYGIPIESVERILPVQPLTKMPKSPKVVIGVFDLRGTTIAAIDARIRFDMPIVDTSNNFVVVNQDDERYAIRVDSVEGIINLTSDEIDSPDSVFSGATDALISGIGKKDDTLTVLLDPSALLPESVRGKLAKAA